METQRTGQGNSPSGRLIAYPIIIIFVLLIAYLFLQQEPSEFPMGDSYIHFVYARNLVYHGELAFNPGIREGVGTTSPLWVFLLSGFYLLKISPLTTAKFLGIGLHILCGFLVYDLALLILTNYSKPINWKLALAMALLAVIPGNNIWIALSGMETALFTVLSLLAIRYYSTERFLFSGFFLGLLALTRIEGIALAMILVGLDLFHKRKISKSIVQLTIPLLLLLSPWLFYLQIREGVPITSSFEGKRIAVAEAESIIKAKYPFLEPFLAIRPLVYLTSWAGYSLLYLYGGIALPGPLIPIPTMWEDSRNALPVATVILGLCLIFPLFIVGFRKLVNLRSSISLEKRAHRIIIGILGWSILHNFIYAILLPGPGAGGRYAPINHMLFWLTVLLGAWLIRNHLIRSMAIIAVILLASFSISYWREVYHANIDYMLNVRIPSSLYINDHYSADTMIGTTDLGPLRWYARQPAVDLIGYVNKDIVRFRKSGGSFESYVMIKKIGALYLFVSEGGPRRGHPPHYAN